MSLMQVARWNYNRNNLILNTELEINMLEEEEQEFKDALMAYFEAEKANMLPDFRDEAILDIVTDMVDAYCDFTFVYYGTAVKRMGDYYNTFDISNRQSIMNTLLTELLITHNVNMFEHGKPPILDLCMSAVIEANEAKPLKKTKSKVSKGKKWKDPKEEIKKILLDNGFVGSVDKALEALKERLEGITKAKQTPVNIEDLEGGEIV